MFQLIRKISFGIMPYKRVPDGRDYKFLCQNEKCALKFKKNLNKFTTQLKCPICLKSAHMIAEIGTHTMLDNGKGMGGFQFHIDRPRPLEECKRDIRLLEESGKMGPNEKRAAKIRLAGLQKDKDLGILDNSVDYQVDGHPIERD